MAPEPPLGLVSFAPPPALPIRLGHSRADSNTLLKTKGHVDSLCFYFRVSMSLVAPARATSSWKNWSSRWYRRTWVCVRITASPGAPACWVRHARRPEALAGVHGYISAETEAVRDSVRDRTKAKMLTRRSRFRRSQMQIIVTGFLFSMTR